MTEKTTTITVNTKELTKQINKLKLSKMGPTTLEKHIKNNLEVIRIENTNHIQFHLKLKE